MGIERTRPLRPAVLLLVSIGCGGSPTEGAPASSDGTGDGTSADGTNPSTTITTTTGSVDGTASGSSDPSGNPSGETSGDTGADPSSDPETSRGTTIDPSNGTSGGAEETTADTMASSSESTTGALGGCDGDPLAEVEPAECSEQSQTESQLQITNDCDFNIEVFWVEYACGETSYQVISPGDGWSIGSYDTHPWRIRNEQTGDLILEIPPLLGDTQIVVE